MQWNPFEKDATKRKRKRLKAYDDIFLSHHENTKPQEIIEHEVKKKLSVVSKIADHGADEKNRLKAAISWLRFSRQLSEVQKIELGGSLSLESRLTEALEGEDKMD
jgi:hypothetical protein